MHILSRDQSSCKGNYIVVHNAACRKEEDDNEQVSLLHFNRYIDNLLNYSSSLRTIILFQNVLFQEQQNIRVFEYFKSQSETMISTLIGGAYYRSFRTVLRYRQSCQRTYTYWKDLHMLATF